MFISTISTNIKTYSIMHQLSLKLLSNSPQSACFALFRVFCPFYSLFNAPSSVNDKPFLARFICLFLAEFQQVDTQKTDKNSLKIRKKW